MLGAVPWAVAQVDQTGIHMTAQDSTGLVWATAWPPRRGGLYQWQNDRWTLAHVQMPENGWPVGVWSGLNGGVVVAWEGGPPNTTLTWYRGSQYRLLGELAGGLSRIHVFSTPPGNVWITTDRPNIYRAEAGGAIRIVYTFDPSQFYTARHMPGRPGIYSPLEVTTDGQGRAWFWSNKPREFINTLAMQGFVIYDGRSFAYHRSITGLPPLPVSFLGPVDSEHFWAAMLGGGIYTIDTRTLTAKRIEEPEPDAFSRVTKIFRAGPDIYVVTDPRTPYTVETTEHRFTSALWRYRKGKWEKVLPGIDDISGFVRALSRPWLATKAGLWLGPNAAGLWFIPRHGRAPRLIDWQQGFPLGTVNALYRIGPADSNRFLAVDLADSRTVELTPKSLLAPARPEASIQVINPFTAIQPDQQQRMWGILTMSGRDLDEWDGTTWIRHPLPGNISPAWLSGLDADSQGHIWLFPGCRGGPIGIYDPRQDAWANFSSYQAALEAQHGVEIKFINSADDRMKPIYGPQGQIAYTGACQGINYFDGQDWRLWNRRDVPGDPRYFFDGPAFFDSGGHLAVNIHHETWEITPGTGWRLIPYQPGNGHVVRWFVPNPPGKPPSGCAFIQSASLANDRLGRTWWTWDGNVYVGVPGMCSALFSASEPQPFIDGRLLRRVLVDSHGNVFFETLIANHRVGEYVIYSPPGPPPSASLRVARLSPDSVRLNFAATTPEKVLYTWRIDGGPWSVPQPQDSAILTALPGGEHRIQADAIDSRLRMDPVPASATVTINVNPQEQVAALIAQLAKAMSDDEREADVEAIERQPAAIALPALRAARANATGAEAWWIDAAIQSITQKPNP